MKTTASNKKVRELISMLNDGTLIPRPEFQRRLVWTRDNKNRFIDTVLKGYPFPEIYFADGDVDLETAKGSQMLVDGQQRVTTLHQYFSGDPRMQLTTVPPYSALDEQQQKDFLGYDVAVRDIGSVTKEQIVEVFQRINATNYSLNDMEINNAVYAGRLKQFAEHVAEHPFFDVHQVFRVSDFKRMGDLRFALSIIVTLMEGYFNRDDALENALRRFNDEFPREEEIGNRIGRTFDFVEECGFHERSRIWKKADLFTAMVEFDQVLNVAKKRIQPGETVDRLQEFYAAVDTNGPIPDGQGAIFVYYKAALQASNDRINRVRRGVIINAVLTGGDPDQALISVDF